MTQASKPGETRLLPKILPIKFGRKRKHTIFEATVFKIKFATQKKKK